VSRGFERFWLPVLLAGSAALLAFANSSLGDYPVDAAPAVDALSGGDLSAYLSAHPIMGPFATLVQAPFALFASGEVVRYQLACLPCLFAIAALGWYLARLAGRRGAGVLGQLLIALLCLVNPLTLEALGSGHPEELLTAALAVGAVVVATQGQAGRAALLLGLAVASKQWAVIAIFPVLMALPSRRIWTAALAAAVVAAFSLPALIASPSAFFDVQGNAASGGRIASIWSLWFPVSPESVRHLGDGLTNSVHEVPPALAPLTHPLIVILVLALPLALWGWRGRFGLDASRAIALLALLALLRCALDPVDNLYYHEPLLIALLAWDAVSPIGRLPLRGLLGAALALLFWRWSRQLGSLDAFNLAYVGTVVAAAIAIATPLFRRGPAPRSAAAAPVVLELERGDLPV
jgi:hypothetical protein